MREKRSQKCRKDKTARQQIEKACEKKRVLVAASVASMISQFNLPNIRLLQQLGYEVHVACNFKEGNTCDTGQIYRLREMLKKLSVRQHQWDCPRDISSVRKCFKAYCQLLALTGRYHFSWIHCHSPVGGALARITAHQRKIRVIYTAHGFHFYQGAPFMNWMLYYPAEKLLSYWTDVLITVNEEDFRFAKQNFRAKRLYRIPGVGINVEYFRDYQPRMAKAEFYKKYHLPADAKILLSVGELSRRKNHRFIISLLPQMGEEVYYFICGQGILRKELQDLAQKTGVEEQIRLTGYVQDLREIYKHADLFVFPSLQEGMPVALEEAMASGLPCLVSDIRGNRELVRFRSCRFDPCCAHSFLKRFRLMIDSSYWITVNQQRMQKQVERYDIRAVKKKLLRIYKSMEDDKDRK